MKKFLCAILAVLMLVTLCACGGNEEKPAVDDGKVENTPVVSDTPVADEKGYAFTDNGVTIEIGGPVASVDALGEPVDTLEEASCAFEGKDVTNFYNNYEILLAYPNEGDSYVSTITILSDAVATEEGLELGMSEDDVKDIYGDAEPQAGGVYVYAKGGMTLRVRVVDGSVDSIEYKVAE